MLPPSPAAAALLWCAGPLVLPIAVQVEAQEELAELAELLVAETRAPAGRWGSGGVPALCGAGAVEGHGRRALGAGAGGGHGVRAGAPPP